MYYITNRYISPNTPMRNVKLQLAPKNMKIKPAFHKEKNLNPLPIGGFFLEMVAITGEYSER